jgi:hypothetical protein
VAAVGITTHFVVADSAFGVGHLRQDLFYSGVPKNFVNFVRGGVDNFGNLPEVRSVRVPVDRI